MAFSSIMPEGYVEQRQAAEMQARLNPDRCGLCRTGIEMFQARRCRTCNGPCCTRCRLTADGRVECFGCIDDEDGTLLSYMGREREAEAAPSDADLRAIEQEIAEATPLCNDCGVPAETARKTGLCVPCWRTLWQMDDDDERTPDSFERTAAEQA